MTHPRMISADEIRSAVHLRDLIAPVADAFAASSMGKADNGLIIMEPAAQREDGDVYVKTATLRGHPLYVVKVAPWFAVNAQQGRRQGGFVAVFDSATGHTLAILNDEHVLSDLRTAAAGAVVADALAPSQVDTALVVGSGIQAFWQPQALYQARQFRTLLVWARNPAKAKALSHRLADVLPGVNVELAGDIEAAVRRADVILTTTPAREPLVHGAWLRPGQHLTAVGADDETKSELDAEALRRARVFVDARDTAAHTGEVHRAIRAGEYQLTALAGEIGDVLNGAVPGRRSKNDITIATLAGLGVQDLAAAEVVLRALDIPIGVR